MSWLKSILKWIGFIFLAIFGILFGLRRHQERQIRRRVDQIEREAEQATSIVEEAREIKRETEHILAEEERRAKERRQRAKELSDRLDKLMIIVVIIALGLIFGRPIFAAEAQLGDYDSLLKKYQEVVDIASQYKALYEDAERSNEILMAQIKALQAQIDSLTSLVERLQKWLDEMQQIVTKLLGRKSIGIIGGVTVTGIDPPSPGAFLGVNLGF